MLDVTDQVLVVSQGSSPELHRNWAGLWQRIQNLGFGSEWSVNDLRQALGSRVEGFPEVSGALVALVNYYGEFEGDRRAREDGFVIRRFTDDPDLSAVLADLLFAAPELGALNVEERPDRVLAVRGCGRTVGLRMTPDGGGRATIRLTNVVSAVNALLAHTPEERRFVPLAPLPGIQTYVFRDSQHAASLARLGLLGASLHELANFAWWDHVPTERSGARRDWCTGDIRAAS